MKRKYDPRFGYQDEPIRGRDSDKLLRPYKRLEKAARRWRTHYYAQHELGSVEQNRTLSDVLDALGALDDLRGDHD